PLNDRLRELLLRLGPKGAGRRNEPLHLRFDRGVPARVAVTEGQTTDSIDCVQVDARLGVAYPEGPTTLRGALLDVAIEGDVPGLVGRPAAIVHGAGDLSKVLPGTQAPGRGDDSDASCAGGKSAGEISEISSAGAKIVDPSCPRLAYPPARSHPPVRGFRVQFRSFAIRDPHDVVLARITQHKMLWNDCCVRGRVALTR